MSAQSSNKVSQFIEKKIRNLLLCEVVTGSFLPLYKGEKKITGNTQLVDQIKEESNVNVTLFWQDERILTTLLNEDGTRIEGTTLEKKIADKVLKLSF